MHLATLIDAIERLERHVVLSVDGENLLVRFFGLINPTKFLLVDSGQYSEQDWPIRKAHLLQCSAVDFRQAMVALFRQWRESLQFISGQFGKR